jgi:hypothetical protein
MGVKKSQGIGGGGKAMPSLAAAAVSATAAA